MAIYYFSMYMFLTFIVNIYCVLMKCVSPWYIRRGWLGVRKQTSFLHSPPPPHPHPHSSLSLSLSLSAQTNVWACTSYERNKITLLRNDDWKTSSKCTSTSSKIRQSSYNISANWPPCHTLISLKPHHNHFTHSLIHSGIYRKVPRTQKIKIPSVENPELWNGIHVKRWVGRT